MWGLITDVETYNLNCFWISLVVQWIESAYQCRGHRFRSLVQEDPTCHGATKPVRHNY